MAIIQELVAKIDELERKIDRLSAVESLVFVNQNVGIGTTTPQKKLDVADDITLRADSDTTNNNTLANANGLIFSDGSTFFWEVIRSTTNGDLRFNKNFGGSGANAVTFERSSGNVGLGTTDPNKMLDVVDDILLQRDNDATNHNSLSAANGLIFGNTTTFFWEVIRSTTNGDLRFNKNFGGAGTNAVTIERNGGNVGLGTTNPGSLLELNLSTEDLEIVDAGSAGATQQDWIEVNVGGVQGYLHVYAST